jgi:hypothetical protein
MGQQAYFKDQGHMTNMPACHRARALRKSSSGARDRGQKPWQMLNFTGATLPYMVHVRLGKQPSSISFWVLRMGRQVRRVE